MEVFVPLFHVHPVKFHTRGRWWRGGVTSPTPSLVNLFGAVVFHLTSSGSMLWKLCRKRHWSSKYQTSLKNTLKGLVCRVHFSSWYVKDLSFLSHMFLKFFLTNSVFFKLLKTVRQEIKWFDVFSSPDKNNLIVMSGNQNNVLVLVKTHRALDTYTHTQTHSASVYCLPLSKLLLIPLGPDLIQ